MRKQKYSKQVTYTRLLTSALVSEHALMKASGHWTKTLSCKLDILMGKKLSTSTVTLMHKDMVTILSELTGKYKGPIENSVT